MAAITYDGQSFMIDGRRIWLVSGTVHMARTPREQWADLINTCKLSGLNAITIPVVWARHEPRPGQFDFTGDNDLKYFVELVGQAGMYAILRMGPYIGGGYDMGGLPPWLLTLKDAALRTANTAFLEATSRFFTALSKQLRDLQATALVAGPIVLVQNEQGWTCGADELAEDYLGELDRYIREAGFEVPILNGNDLWQGVEGEIECWSGSTNMLSNLRQLASVRPSQPRIVGEFRVGSPQVWGEPVRQPELNGASMSPSQLQRRLAEVLAAGAQFNIEPMFGGTSFGFSAGRLGNAPARFLCTSHDCGAPIDAAGRPGPLREPLRRVAMFARSFGRVLAHLDPKRQLVTMLPSEEAGDNADSGPVVVHAGGSQGSVVFVFRGERPEKSGKASRDTNRPVRLLLPNGEQIPVYTGEDPVCWVLVDVRLAGRAQLDYCNLSAFALVGKAFVVAGPRNTPVRMSINGSPLEATVPADGTPEIIEHESMTIVIVADDDLPSVQVTDDAVFINADAVTSAGEAVVHTADQEVTRIGADGLVTTMIHELAGGSSKRKHTTPPAAAKPRKPIAVHNARTAAAAAKAPAAGSAAKPAKGKSRPAPAPMVEPAPPPPPPPMPKLHLQPPPRSHQAPAFDAWTCAPLDDYIDGSSARFASISGPTDLNRLGAATGYGWYRLSIRPRSAGRTDVAWPDSADRLHLFLDAHDAGVLGVGPGASHDAALNLKKKDQTLVVLAENFGRFAEGQHLGEPKGAFGHLLEVKPAKFHKPVLRKADPVAPLTVRSPLMEVHEQDLTDPLRVAWEWNGKRKNPLLVRINLPKNSTIRGVILLNSTPVRFFDAAGPGNILMLPDDMAKGANVLELAILGDAQAAITQLQDALEFLDVTNVLTDEAEWAFAKWERPGDEAFRPLRSAGRQPGPAWFKGTFNSGSHREPLLLHMAGMTKGQVYVNGRHIGRYFTADAKGHDVGPQIDLLIPEAFIRPGQSNEVAIFDEHGHTPGRVKLLLCPEAKR